MDLSITTKSEQEVALAFCAESKTQVQLEDVDVYSEGRWGSSLFASHRERRKARE